MKGEIFRRLSLEIIKDEGVEREHPVRRDIEKEKIEDIEGTDDYLEKTIGAFGLWQAVVCVTVCLTRAIATWNMMSLSFLTPVVEFICVEFSDNVTVDVQNSTCYDNCLKYKYASVVGRTIVEDFGLICENAWLASIVQSIMMFGILIGSWTFGWISDRFGRRVALLLSTFINAVFMIALPFSPTYIVFASIRFVTGVATGGSLLICVVMIMEVIGKKQRDVAGACILIPDGLAQAALAGFAYFTSNWQSYTLSYAVATCLIFVSILFVPESPRWLLANGKVDEAIKVITRAANRNKLDATNIKTEITKALEELKLKENEIVKTSYLDFFKTKALTIMTSTIIILWFALGLYFYGIFQYMSIIGINLYITVAILGVIEIPICPVAIVINQRFGRKISTVGSTLGMVTTMFIIIFVPQGSWIVTLFGALGFIFGNISFVISYIHLSELYPTPLRNMSYSLASGGAKIGAMIAPFVANLSIRWLPSTVFCVFAVICVMCCLQIPETKGQNLKDKIEK